MKKALGGCLIVALLLLVLGGGALWWFVLRPAWQAGSQFMGAATQLAEIAQIDMQVRNAEAWTPPADGAIPEASLQRFIAVQQALQSRAGTQLRVLETKYQELEAQHSATGADPGLADVLGAYGDLFALLREAKLAQVDALNAQGMSLDEYRWVRTAAYSAVGLTESDTAPAMLEGSALASNAERLRPHRELLLQTAATAWLGF